ncbi:hypothetical protein [Olleya aquimaris]|uniref:Uncharacterized protein n=1 Tax=Olleya aquimaris TaxID=639310 RepID=A0A327RGU4_9FLAO|nr:hypothetical protein [Olleya aquimaris]RAJ16236.1 hypothetical protein LY08_01094 [Olleya aquimaris]
MKDFSIEDIKNNVSTKPLRSLGSNIVTHRLQKVKDGYAYKPTFLLVSAYLLMFLIGLVLVGYAIFKMVTTNSFSILEESYIMTGIGILFFIIGIYIVYSLFIPIKFDTSINRFYRSFNTNHKKKSAHFKDIVALQILGELVPNGESNENEYKSYEVNLVLQDGSRINLIDYTNLDSITKDTNTLSTFLNVPIWKV